ncbi:MAG: hypothetical protein HRU24_13115 [Gammaproteobacteria bacterium]|nr:hypothetical protein [Gammaproteobacteria bacterium]
MLKSNILILLFLISISSFSSNVSAGFFKKGELLACEAVVCVFGTITLDTNPAECDIIFAKWAVYKATLGMFESPPKCRNRDKDGNVTSEVAVDCNIIQNEAQRAACIGEGGPGSIVQTCDQYDTWSEREQCELEQCRERNDGQVCEIP